MSDILDMGVLLISKNLCNSSVVQPRNIKTKFSHFFPTNTSDGPKNSPKFLFFAKPECNAVASNTFPERGSRIESVGASLVFLPSEANK